MPATRGPVWARDQHHPGRRPALSADRIVAAALAVADADGLDGVSMRRVATELGSGTTSLYRHVASRDDLLELMVDAVQAAEPLPPATGDWRADLTAIARSMRQQLLRHPWLGSQLMVRPALGPHSLRQIDGAYAAASALVGDITTASGVIFTLTNYVLGAVGSELAEQAAHRRTGLTEQQWRQTVAPYIRRIVASGDYPYFSRQVIDGADLTGEQRFEFGLACLLDGFAPLATR